jgi:hypothetical protein
MFKKIINIAVLSLLMNSSAMAHYVYSTSEDPNNDVWILDCSIYRIESEFPQKMTINSITVMLKVDPNNSSLQGMRVIHHLKDGTQVSRAEQYPDADIFTLDPTHMHYKWKGENKKSPLSMEGEIIFARTDKIIYEERSYWKKKQNYVMDSYCKFIDLQRSNTITRDKSDRK